MKMATTDSNECKQCNGTGQTCAECLEADGECTCADGPELISCGACDGTGDADEEEDDEDDDIDENEEDVDADDADGDEDVD